MTAASVRTEAAPTRWAAVAVVVAVRRGRGAAGRQGRHRPAGPARRIRPGARGGRLDHVGLRPARRGRRHPGGRGGGPVRRPPAAGARPRRPGAGQRRRLDGRQLPAAARHARARRARLPAGRGRGAGPAAAHRRHTGPRPRLRHLERLHAGRHGDRPAARRLAGGMAPVLARQRHPGRRLRPAGAARRAGAGPRAGRPVLARDRPRRGADRDLARAAAAGLAPSCSTACCTSPWPASCRCC